MKEDILNIIYNPTIQKFLIATLIAYSCDFATGFTKAWTNKNIKSTKLRNGLAKFIEYVCVLIIGIMFDFLFNQSYFTIGLSVTIVAIEVKSITENISETQLKKKISSILKIFNKTYNDDFDEDIYDEDNYDEE